MLSNFAQNSFLYIYTHILFLFMLLITWSSRSVQSWIQRDLSEDRVVITDRLVIKAWWEVPTGFTSFKLVYGKSCHLPVELEHDTFWALKFFNFDQEQVGEKEEGSNARIERNARWSVESSKVYKEEAKSFHDKRIVKQNLEPGQMVLLFNSILSYFRESLSWSGPVRL